ncbi:transcription-repair coupling factor [Holosporaceae bacterium 'Namur']|nr:transcription-repair coupling factor [Holosporaceae bacterium 'Namur']
MLKQDFLEQKNLYLPKGTEAKVIAQYLETSDFVCYVASRESEIDNISIAINFFMPSAEVVYFPAWDALPYDRVSPSSEVGLQRIKTLSRLLESKNSKKVLITTFNNLLQKTFPKELLLSTIINIELNSKISRDVLLNNLNTLGYLRSITANEPGEYAIRGGIIDIVSSNDGKGFRISFFGNEVDSLKLFDTETQLSLEKVEECTIYPVSEIIINDETADTFKTNYRKLFGVLNDPLLEAVSAKSKYTGMEHWLPLFYDNLSNLFDYIPAPAVVLYHDRLIDDLNEQYKFIDESYATRIKLSTDKNYHPLNPTLLYLTPEECKTNLHKYISKALYSFREENSIQYFSPAINLFIESKANNLSTLTTLRNYIEQFRTPLQNKNRRQNRFVICCFTEGSRGRLKNMLLDNSFHAIDINCWDEINNLSGKTLGLAILPIEQGFTFENYIFLSEQDLLGERLSRVRKRKKNSAKFLQEANTLSEGEFVVHIDHGIGRFEKLETLEVAGAIHDFIKITYRDDDKLYVPVENLEVISKYGGDDIAVTLDKLGGVAWQTRKAKLKNRLKIAAEELLKTAAKREVEKGIVLEAIPDMYEKFCRKFPYMETEDQLSAIEDIEQDLRSGKPLDRLVCGDVGFGKTEVALRAAAIAVLSADPMQVAVIVPTTLLSRQHYQNFSNRFADFPVRIAQLSRFVPKKEADQVKKDLEEGKVDIIIGTHALLSNDIKFKNLGLIIIDEEQHFGVAQKEKLKKLKSYTHIITLSATPIPRTLQMSLSGIKDLSLITTPPVDRQPIKTYIMPYDAFIIREAILRECARGGRTFYVTPRISYLDELKLKLKEILPEIKVVRAHGQMPASKLDQIMNDFYDGKFEVLLSTTIVESGLDIPFANTMIIDKADMFGLAQLYQIRGRVGRSNNKAYAYLITGKGYNLHPIAKRRLEVIQSLETLGAGFTVASHDMDIRGHGNLIGEEQSGHIKEVGLELYQDMLAEAIEKLKLNNTDDEPSNWSPTINIGVSVQIPESYISDDSLRLSIYRKIAQISEIKDLESFAAELIDRFGNLPEEAEQLFAIIKLKQLAKQLNIEKIDLGDKALVINFKNGKPGNKANPLEFIRKHSDHAKLRADGKLLIMREWKTQNAKIKGVENILIQLGV